jgi:peroxiredoxin Q/BCP
LLCDPSATLIGAIGFKKVTGTTRGVFAVDKSGKVLAAEPGGPAATVQVIKKLVTGTDSAVPVGSETTATGEAAEPAAAAGTAAEAKEDASKATVAAEVADTAQKLDPPTPIPT